MWPPSGCAGTVAGHRVKILGKGYACEGLCHDAKLVNALPHHHAVPTANLDVALLLPEPLRLRVADDDAQARRARALRAHPRFKSFVQRARGAEAVQRRRHDEEADVQTPLVNRLDTTLAMPTISPPGPTNASIHISSRGNSGGGSA